MTELKQAQRFDLPLQDKSSAALKSASHYQSDDFKPESVERDITPLKSNSRWWWRLAGITGVGVAVLALAQWVQLVVDSWQQSIVSGALLSALSASILLLISALLWREITLWRRLARNRRWQQSAVRIRNSVQYGEAKPLCRDIVSSLPASTAIQAAVQQWQGAVTDEHSDEEQLQLFEHFVLKELDKQAQQLIYRAATDTSLAVAISPFALADMLLVLWRSSRMVREVAQLYGAGIGQLRSLVLLKRFLAALLWAGGSELALDMASDVIGSELTAKLSARAGQGMIAGLLVARLGNLAQQQLRPLPASSVSKVNISKLAASLQQRFKAALQTKADTSKT
ncbi:MAG TPA: TIGR01620 family protein [Rheinheimera sp.]|nr:TIGR01620 family protein [Rheinheimera sp.]